jgi:hypothetical protein
MSTEAKAKPATQAKQPAAEAEDDGYSKRIEQIRAKRRERGVSTIVGYKLRQPDDKYDPRYVYRWTNEENCQLRQSEATFGGDWEFVPNKDGHLDDGRNVEQGAKVARICDKGTGKRTVWMRKPRELYDDDQKIKAERIVKLKKEMERQGAKVLPTLASEGEDNSNIYTPKDVVKAYRP